MMIDDKLMRHGQPLRGAGALHALLPGDFSVKQQILRCPDS